LADRAFRRLPGFLTPLPPGRAEGLAIFLNPLKARQQRLLSRTIGLARFTFDRVFVAERGFALVRALERTAGL
jgi:hypothetical protein